MGDMREALRDGDQTTSGGVLEAPGPGLDHGGRRVAGDGDWASCPSCKKGGKVINDAFPNSTLPDGRQILVRGAKVMCSCSDKPLVIPSQQTFKIEVNRSGVGQPTPAPAGSTTPFDEAFILKDKLNGGPLANVEYRIRFADGRVESTDESGHTHVATTADSEPLILEVRT
jgi:uncharacterized Zn-binding protein involved in type VI secretion